MLVSNLVPLLWYCSSLRLGKEQKDTQFWPGQVSPLSKDSQPWSGKSRLGAVLCLEFQLLGILR